MSFADDIRKLRRKSLLSQNDFAKEIGVSYTTVSRWETGKSRPNLKTMRQIDKYCKENNIDFDIGNDLFE